jgi:hypothetical protein
MEVFEADGKINWRTIFIFFMISLVSGTFLYALLEEKRKEEKYLR